MTRWMRLSCLILLIATAAGYEMYDVNKEICCQGKVHSRSEEKASETRCCGAKPMFYSYGSNGFESKTLCCDGQLRLPLNITDKCCGKELVDNYNFACFNGNEVVEIPELEKEKGNTSVCGKSINELTFFDPFLNDCCDGVLYERNLTNRHFCFGTQYVSEDTHHACRWYNEETQKMEHTLVALDGRDKYNTNCCNNELYVFEKQFCFNQKVHEKDEVFSKNCCGRTFTHKMTIYGYGDWSAVVNANGSDDEDCDRLMIEGDELSCYRNNLIPMALLRQNHSVCYYDFSLYKTDSQTCCPSGVRNLTGSEIQNGTLNCCKDDAETRNKHKMDYYYY